MEPHHDPASGSVDRLSEPAVASQLRSDPLSDVLRTVKLQGALFFLIEASDPWCVDVPPAADYADIILPRARHVVSYHIAVEGAGVASVPGLEPVRFSAGDIIVFPHQDPYVMASGIGVAPEFDQAATIAFFRELAAARLPFVIPEGGGGEPRAKFVCGYLGCDVGPNNPLFAALPPLVRIRRDGDAPDLLDRLVDLTMTEARLERAGGGSIRLGLSELLFVEALRRHLTSARSEGPSWLAGLSDALVGKALRALHADPARAWSLDSLAVVIGTSRSVLAERFLAIVGQSPMRYLTMWRMQLAARYLSDGVDKVAAVAERVGFTSEAAFSRAFKREMGCPPAAWRDTRH